MATSQRSLRAVLERVAAELKDEEAKEELAELREALGEGKKLTLADIRDVIAEAPPEERAELRALLAEELDGDPPAPPRKKDDPPAPPPTDDPPKPTNRRVRPGRKSGQAYDWYVDADTGEVTRSPVAVIYSGEDEPDEVEMLPDTSTREAEDDQPE